MEGGLIADIGFAYLSHARPDWTGVKTHGRLLVLRKR